MAQTTFSIRMDSDLKKDFDKLCEEFGMSMSTAINVFARAVVRERRIPFELRSPHCIRRQPWLERLYGPAQAGAAWQRCWHERRRYRVRNFRLPRWEVILEHVLRSHRH